MLSTLCGGWYGPNRSYPICNQFVLHLSIWVPPAILMQWHIRSDEVEQQPGQFIVTGSGVYHEGWNGGPNVAEAVNYDGPENTQREGYRPCFPSCWPNPEVYDSAHGFVRKDLDDTQLEEAVELTWTNLAWHFTCWTGEWELRDGNWIYVERK